MKVAPADRITGRLRLTGDKSISHRAAIIAAIARGTSHLTNFSASQDCESTLNCLRRLGVSIEREENNVRVEGVGRHGFRPPAEVLDCGNSGSTIRMLAGVLSGQRFTSTLTGDVSLRSRPMARIIGPLQLMGARILSESGRPPLRIEGCDPLEPIKYELPVASSQVKSCLLFAGLHARGLTQIIEPDVQTRDHTERMLNWFGVPVQRTQEQGKLSSNVVAISGPASLASRDLRIPGDISSAAFLIAAAILLPGSRLEIEDVGLNPTRTQFLSTLRCLGADVSLLDVHEESNEPVGEVAVSASCELSPRDRGKSNRIRGLLIPQLIDELPLLAVVGTQITGGIEIRDATELRVKESDRIAATVKNLRAMGAEVEEYEDGLAVAGPTRLRGATLDSYGDHRIAMAFTVAALVAAGDSEIVEAECVGISFPEFFTLLESIVER